MKELTIGRNDAGQRLDRFLAKAVPLLPASLAQKYIRLKRIKCNNARAQRDTRLQEGDVLQLYINDEFFDKPSEAENAYLTVTAPKLNIVYEDENILLVDKKPGVAVHPHDGAELRPHAHRPHSGLSLCKRGVAAARGAGLHPGPVQPHRPQHRRHRHRGQDGRGAAHPEPENSSDRELDKRYLAVVEGTPRPETGVLKGYLFKDAVKNRVFVTDTPQKGAKTCETRYRTLYKARRPVAGGV